MSNNWLRQYLHSCIHRICLFTSEGVTIWPWKQPSTIYPSSPLKYNEVWWIGNTIKKYKGHMFIKAFLQICHFSLYTEVLTSCVRWHCGHWSKYQVWCIRNTIKVIYLLRLSYKYVTSPLTPRFWRVVCDDTVAEWRRASVCLGRCQTFDAIQLRVLDSLSRCGGALDSAVWDPDSAPAHHLLGARVEAKEDFLQLPSSSSP